MKTKLTLTDCYKYPNAVIREYKRDKVIHEYKNLLELLAFKCVTVWIKPKYQLKEANKYLAKCKLVLKDAVKEVELKRIPFEKNILYLSDVNPLISKLRAGNFDIDGMEESGRAVYE